MNYLYNGVEMPKLPDRDETTHPYVTIGFNGNGYTYEVFYTSSPMIFKSLSSDGTKYYGITSDTAVACEAYWYHPKYHPEYDDNYNYGTSANSIQTNNVFYANYDILDADGSVYFAASEDPVPLKLELSAPKIICDATVEPAESNGFYLALLDVNFAAGDVLDVVFNEQSYTLTAKDGDGMTYLGEMTDSGPCFTNYPFLIAYAGSYGYAYTENTGTYSVKIIEHGLGGTTAVVDFTCSELLQTDSVYRIKAWVYKTVDGLDTSLSASYTSELFGGPSYSESVTFDGLSPETGYGVYAIILKNEEETDYTADGTFTTMAYEDDDSSDDDYGESESSTTISNKLLRLYAIKQDLFAATQEIGLDTTQYKFTNLHELWSNIEGGNLQEKTVNPSDVDVVVTPDEGYDALSKVLIEIAKNIQPRNIREGVTIFGKTGTAKIKVDTTVPDGLPVTKDEADEHYKEVTGEDPVDSEGNDLDMMILDDGTGNITYGYFLKSEGSGGFESTWTVNDVAANYVKISDRTFTADEMTGFSAVAKIEVDGEIQEVDLSESMFLIENMLFMYSSSSTFSIVNVFAGNEEGLEQGLYYNNAAFMPEGTIVTLTFPNALGPQPFSITSYDPVTTEFKAIGWRRLSYHIETDSWTDDDFSCSASGGWNYLKNIIMCSRDKLYYAGYEVWPNNTIYKSGNLADDSWENISMIAKSGHAANVYSVGDEKDIELTNGEIITVRIIEIGHINTLGNESKENITFEMKHCLATTYQAEASVSAGEDNADWKTSQMRTMLRSGGAISEMLPDDLKSVIATIDKPTRISTSMIDVMAEYCFLLSEIEIFGEAINSFYTKQSYSEGSQYEFYKNGGSRVKYLSNGSGDAVSRWTRSTHLTDYESYCSVDADGEASSNVATDSIGVSFAFCV